MASSVPRRQTSGSVRLFGKDDQTGVACSRHLLATSCGYFEKLFSWNASQDQAAPLRSEIHLGLLQAEALEILVKVVEGCSVQLTGHNVRPVLQAADFLICHVVQLYCERYVEKAQPGDCLVVLQEAADDDKLFMHVVVQSAKRALMRRGDVVLQVDELVAMSHEELLKLVASDDLVAESETTVFHNVVHWFRHDRLTRITFLPQLLAFIRFALMPRDYLQKLQLARMDADVFPLIAEHVAEAIDLLPEVGSTPYRPFEYTHPTAHVRSCDYRLVVHTEHSTIMHILHPFTGRILPFPSSLTLTGYEDEEDGYHHPDVQLTVDRLYNSPKGGVFAYGDGTDSGVEFPVHFRYQDGLNRWIQEYSEHSAFEYPIDELFYPTPSRSKIDDYGYRVCTVSHYLQPQNVTWTLQCFISDPEVGEEPFEIDSVAIPFQASFDNLGPVGYNGHLYLFHCSKLEGNDLLRGRRVFRCLINGKYNWQELTPSPIARHTRADSDTPHHHSIHVSTCIAPGGKMYFVGDTASVQETNYVEVYDLVKDEWKVLQRKWVNVDEGGMGRNKLQHVTVFGGKIMVLESGEVETRIWVCEAESTEWKMVKRLDGQMLGGKVAGIVPFPALVPP